MSEDYFIEILLKEPEFEFLRRGLLLLATNPLLSSEDQRKASQLHDQIKEQHDE